MFRTRASEGSAVTDSLNPRWVEQTPEFRDWLAQHPAALPKYLTASREADIWVVHEGTVPRFVIKRWRRDGRASARGEYRLLGNLASLGLPAVRGAGWGFDSGEAPLLATGAAGSPVDRADPADLAEFGRTLARLHRAPLRRLDLPAPRDSHACFDGVRERFFEGVDAFSDLALLLEWAGESLPSLEPTLLHGDYHLGNVTKYDAKLWVLDWSDAHVGDWRSDVAWTQLLTRIYSGEAARQVFLQAYEEAVSRTLDTSMRPFEVVAALRWLLLSRTAPFPVPPEWCRTAYEFIQSRLPSNLRTVLVPPAADR